MANVVVGGQSPRTVVVAKKVTRFISVGQGPAAKVWVGNRPHVTVSVNEDHTKVVKVGMQGPVGVPGAEGEPGVGSISAGFSHSALPGPIEIGTIPAGRKIQSIVVKVQTAFETGRAMTVGTDTAQALLLIATESSLQNVGMYEKTINLEYPEAQEIKAFFIGGSSATGFGEITIFIA